MKNSDTTNPTKEQTGPAGDVKGAETAAGGQPTQAELDAKAAAAAADAGAEKPGGGAPLSDDRASPEPASPESINAGSGDDAGPVGLGQREDPERISHAQMDAAFTGAVIELRRMVTLLRGVLDSSFGEPASRFLGHTDTVIKFIEQLR